MAAFLQGGGAVTAMQIHFNESRAYPGAEVEEESTGSAPVAFGLVAPGS